MNPAAPRPEVDMSTSGGSRVVEEGKGVLSLIAGGCLSNLQYWKLDLKGQLEVGE